MRHLLFIFTLLFSANLIAQYNNSELPLSINKNGTTPNNSAILDVNSSNKGFLMPRLTTAQRAAINNPADGLMVFDMTTGSFWYYFNSAWREISASENNQPIPEWGNQSTTATEDQKVSVAGEEDRAYRYSSSISDDYAIIGVYEGVWGYGSAYIYHKTKEGWKEQAILLPDTLIAEGFGLSVDISGDYAMVGAWYDDLNGFNKGLVYIFRNTGTEWIRDAKIISDTPDNFNTFGSAISISADGYAIVGINSYDYYGSGIANIYKKTNNSWTKQALLTDGIPFSNFGNAVSISEDYAVISASNSSQKGEVYIYDREGNYWNLNSKLVANDVTALTKFGISIDTWNDYIIVGALGDNKSIAYIFKRSGEIWTQQAKLILENGFSYSTSTSVGITDNYAIVIGSSENYFNGILNSKIYLFKQSGSGWLQQVELITEGDDEYSLFSSSVDISKNHVVATNTLTGQVYFYGKE